MSETGRLKLPYLEAAQAQKHLTHNEALARLDALVHLTVVSDSQVSPPADPAESTCFLVPVSATGGFLGHDGEIACWEQGAWQFLTPNTGWLCFVADRTALVIWQSDAWVSLPIDRRNIAALDAANSFTAAQTIGAGPADADAPFLTLSPTDRGAGKPDLYLKKSATADAWDVGLWDGTGNNGKIGFYCQSLVHNGATLYSTNNAAGLVQGMKRTQFAGSGVWTPHPECIAAEIELCGGGGGGGGYRAAAGVAGGGAAGGAGSSVRKLLAADQIPVRATITIGAGGAGGSAGQAEKTGSAGGSGGDSQYDDQAIKLTAPGGGGGAIDGDEDIIILQGGTGGAAATGGDENFAGQPGADCVGGRNVYSNGLLCWSVGAGGSPVAPLGQGSPAMRQISEGADLSSDGLAAIGYGGGGGGAAVLGVSSGNGATGGGGFCRITEWVGK